MKINVITLWEGCTTDKNLQLVGSSMRQAISSFWRMACLTYRHMVYLKYGGYCIDWERADGPK